MELKKDILWRIYLIYFFICVFGVVIIYKISVIQFAEGEQWRAQSNNFSTKLFDVEAVRGNIYDNNGILLATSLPYYEVGMDVNTDAITKDIFYDNVDSLSYCFATLFKDKSQKDYKKLLVKARKSGDRWVTLQRGVSYSELQLIKKFPLLRKGRNRGGFTYIQTNKRERPFQNLAARTIGKYNEAGTGKSYGLEVAYNSFLKGESGQRLMQKIAGGVWKEMNDDDDDFKLEDGADVISTIDINIQDVAENSLKNCLKKHGASYGCLVLMEVKTGEIKAISNLTRKDSNNYVENLNYAVAYATEPGSTFKLASLITAMEDGYIDLDDVVDIEDGTHKYYNSTMKDSHHPEKSEVTVQQIFEQSSNVGVSKIITRYYSKDPQKFVDRLCQMNLNSPLKVSLPGEATPRIKNIRDKDWSGTTLPWMSIGYELTVTPLQTLTFYNAVANNGKMMRPMFVKEIRKRGKTVKVFEPEIINSSICSQPTIDKAKKMMEGVVTNGTAKSLKMADYKVAGKTGTAQIAKDGDYKKGGVTYLASFVGYFPADNPKYSCIVVVSAPTGDAYYGGAVAGPVFKDVADKVYSTSLDIHKEINAVQPVYAKHAPTTKSGSVDDLNSVLKTLKVSVKSAKTSTDWVSATTNDSVSINLSARYTEETLKKGIVPNLVGMTAQDALYLLENNGIRVKLIGGNKDKPYAWSGAIAKQSLEAGTTFIKGTEIILQLI
jgi:cell division protein FtsI (penicillin-binding protein 3)